MSHQIPHSVGKGQCGLPTVQPDQQAPGSSWAGQLVQAQAEVAASRSPGHARLIHLDPTLGLAQ